MVVVRLCVMTLGADTPGGIRRMTESTADERAALEGMLRAYPVEQLVEEVLVAWQELADRNEDLVTSKQRLRVLELDLAERKDEVAPEVAQLKVAESQLEESSARIVHLERLLEDSKKELDENRASISVEEREALEFIYDTRNKFDSGRIEEIDSSWIRDGKPLNSEDYERSRTGVGAMFANLFK